MPCLALLPSTEDHASAGPSPYFFLFFSCHFPISLSPFAFALSVFRFFFHFLFLYSKQKEILIYIYRIHTTF